MFQIAFGIGTDNSSTWWWDDAIRSLFGVFDMVVYTMISYIYQILFTIADSSILSSEYVKAFYDRFQIIISVVMIFKLAISVLNYVVNPDMMTDKKAGIGNVIVRIVGMLVMYTAIIPLSIPNATANSYEAYLNDYGLLFGTLYSLQYRILGNNTIDKLILGTSRASGNASSIEESGNAFATNVLKTFITLNSACQDHGIDYDNIKTPSELISNIKKECNNSGLGNHYYELAYLPIVSTVIGAIILYVLAHFCIDVAIRALKLAILRIISPIPIINYIDPKSSEKGAFANWIKQIISTFAQLFIILAVMFFSFDIIGRIFDPGQSVLDIPIMNGVNFVNTFATILIVLAILLFAGQAPRFIMDLLGIKGTGLIGISGALGGLGAMMGGAGVRGLASGSLNAMRDASTAAAQGKAAPPAYSTQRDKIAQMLTGDKNAQGGFFGGLQRAANDRTNNAMAMRNRNTVGQAKSEMYRLQGEASTAEERYKRFSTGNMDGEEKSDIQTSAAFRDFVQNSAIGREYRRTHGNVNTFEGLTPDEQDDLFRTYLENDWSSKQTAAKKQEAWYKEGSQILEGMDINETLQEKYSSTRRHASIRQARAAAFADSHDNILGRAVGTAGRVYGSVAGSYGQRRSNRLNNVGPGFDEPLRREYGRSHEHRTEASVGHDDQTRI